MKTGEFSNAIFGENYTAADTFGAFGIDTVKKKPKPLLDWTPQELLIVARTCGWLPANLDLNEEWDGKRAKIGDYAIVAKDVRNLAVC